MNRKRVTSTLLLASLACGGLDLGLGKGKSVDERFKFEKTPTTKNLPNNYNKLNHMSSKQRKRYLAKKRRNKLKGDDRQTSPGPSPKEEFASGGLHGV